MHRKTPYSSPRTKAREIPKYKWGEDEEEIFERRTTSFSGNKSYQLKDSRDSAPERLYLVERSSKNSRETIGHNQNSKATLESPVPSFEERNKAFSGATIIPPQNKTLSQKRTFSKVPERIPMRPIDYEEGTIRVVVRNQETPKIVEINFPETAEFTEIVPQTIKRVSSSNTPVPPLEFPTEEPVMEELEEIETPKEEELEEIETPREIVETPKEDSPREEVVIAKEDPLGQLPPLQPELRESLLKEYQKEKESSLQKESAPTKPQTLVVKEEIPKIQISSKSLSVKPTNQEGQHTFLEKMKGEKKSLEKKASSKKVVEKRATKKSESISKGKKGGTKKKKLEKKGNKKMLKKSSKPEPLEEREQQESSNQQIVSEQPQEEEILQDSNPLNSSLPNQESIESAQEAFQSEEKSQPSQTAAPKQEEKEEEKRPVLLFYSDREPIESTVVEELIKRKGIKMKVFSFKDDEQSEQVKHQHKKQEEEPKEKQEAPVFVLLEDKEVDSVIVEEIRKRRDDDEPMKVLSIKQEEKPQPNSSNALEEEKVLRVEQTHSSSPKEGDSFSEEKNSLLVPLERKEQLHSVVLEEVQKRVERDLEMQVFIPNYEGSQQAEQVKERKENPQDQVEVEEDSIPAKKEDSFSGYQLTQSNVEPEKNSTTSVGYSNMYDTDEKVEQSMPAHSPSNNNQTQPTEDPNYQPIPVQDNFPNKDEADFTSCQPFPSSNSESSVNEKKEQVEGEEYVLDEEEYTKIESVLNNDFSVSGVTEAEEDEKRKEILAEFLRTKKIPPKYEIVFL